MTAIECIACQPGMQQAYSINDDDDDDDGADADIPNRLIP